MEVTDRLGRIPHPPKEATDGIFSLSPSIRTSLPSFPTDPIDVDALDHHLLTEIQADARLSYAELGRRVGLSPPAVADRLRRLEADGVVTGYHAAVDPARLGRPVRAFLHLQVDRAHFPRAVAAVQAMDEVLTCHRTTGSSSLVMTVAVASVEALEVLIDKLLPFGEPVTQMILSTPIARRSVTPAASGR